MAVGLGNIMGKWSKLVGVPHTHKRSKGNDLTVAATCEPRTKTPSDTFHESSWLFHRDRR